MKVRLFASVVGLSTVALVSNGCSGDSSDGKTPAGGGGSDGALDLSALGALVVNLVIAVNHRRDRYIAT